MRTKLNGIFTLLLVFVVQLAFAQSKTISGTVKDGEGMPVPGVNVLLKGTQDGTQTDFDGKYSLEVSEGDVLVFSYVGFKKVEKTVGSGDTIDVSLKPDTSKLDEVVITALGIEREKKSLGYSTQEVSGDAVSEKPTTNFVNALSGKVSGLNINPSGTLGGSTDVVIRGKTSLTGNNQALFVIDGTPIDNSNNSNATQGSGRGGYDYGNAASDIDPENIKSINVLKGAAATALYGSRGSNGVVIIETKKGSKNSGIGVSVKSTFKVSEANDETLPDYQRKYGAGYGTNYQSFDGYFGLSDINGDGIGDRTTPFTEDASFGAPYDPNKQVYQWNSIYPQLDSYQKASPWTAPEHDANDIWRTGTTAINSFSIDGGNDDGSFRVDVTNFDQKGNLPNSRIKRNTLKFGGSYDLTDDLTASANVTYTKTDGRGRYGTGYDSRNIMQSFRDFYQTNVDIYKQRDAYQQTGQNITWNPNSASNRTPIYTDNPYWVLNENYETDTRNRYFGNFNLNYKINDIFTLAGRFSFDTYDELQEERIAVGSADVAEYSRYNNRQSEYNYNLTLNVDTDISDEVSLNGNIGYNLRRNTKNSIAASTNGGLSVEGLYSLSNSAGPITPPSEVEYASLIDGIYARANFGFYDTYFLEGTIRRDRSSTLPTDNNTYYYPSVSATALLSNIMDDADWLSFAKVRANYAEVGSDTGPYNLRNTYSIGTPFQSGIIASNPSTQKNPNLKPERSKSYEFGLEANFLEDRVGFDVTYYNNKTEDQITAVPISATTGYTKKFLNAGAIENKGWEVQLHARPLEFDKFSWDITVNWSRNRSEVVSLADGIDNLRLNPYTLQGGVSINAAPGERYGTIRGTDYVYNENGKKVVGGDGLYKTTDSNNEKIGNIRPDWTGGVSNTFSYGNLSLSFLIDVQHGGDIFSLDTWYGDAVGLTKNTVGQNDLGNPMRSPVTGGNDSGGIILPGVQADGSPNTQRIPINTVSGNPFGYTNDANAGHIYDASFVKLREASITYNFGEDIIDQLPITKGSFSIIGRNLWIIHKNIPYSDPEAGLSSGKVQGYQSGAYPSFRSVGASLKLNF